MGTPQPRTGLHWELPVGEAPAGHSGHPWEPSCNHGRRGRVTTSRGQSTAAVGAARSVTSWPSAAAPCSAHPRHDGFRRGPSLGQHPPPRPGSGSRGDSS